MNFRVYTAPIKLPVSIEEARVHLEITDPTDPDESSLMYTKLGLFIGAAREAYEATANRTIHQTVYEAFPDSFPSEGYLELPRATPLVSIDSVTLRNSSEVESTWDTAEWIADTGVSPGRLLPRYNFSWSEFTQSPSSPIKIRYTAGLATASPEVEADDDIKLPILMLVAAMYENREAEVLTETSQATAVLLEYGFKFFRNLRRATWNF